MPHERTTNCFDYLFDFGSGIAARNGRFTRLVRAEDTCERDEETYEYCRDEAGLVQPSATILPAKHADLIDIATAAYLADLRAPRRKDRHPDDSPSPFHSWKRNVSLSIPVRDSRFWDCAAIKQDLTRLLGFLTGDVWSFEFRTRKADARQSEVQRTLSGLHPTQSHIAILHSGGMDALLGMIRASTQYPDARLAAISSISHSRVRSVQHSLVKWLRQAQQAEWPWLQHTLNFINGKRHLGERESSQRSRGFLYLAIGAVAAELAGCSELQMAENGVGAISLPYTPDQFGALTNKSAHPRTLMLFERFYNHVSGSALRVTNPSLWWTKSELIADVVNQAPANLGDAISQTVSCDRFPWNNDDQACGTCSSCVFRRMASVATPEIKIDNLSWRQYDFDPLVTSADWSRPDLVAYGAIQSQAAILRMALSGMSPHESLRDRYPDLTSVEACAKHLQLSPEELQNRIVRLYRRHIDEVDMLIAAFSTPDQRLLEESHRVHSTRRATAS